MDENIQITGYNNDTSNFNRSDQLLAQTSISYHD
jgi:hypothetical protein